MDNTDIQQAYRRLTGRRETSLKKIREQFPDLAERARALIPARKPPNPPGWAYLTSSRS